LEDLGWSTRRAMTRLIGMGVPLKRQACHSETLTNYNLWVRHEPAYEDEGPLTASLCYPWSMVLVYVLKESVVS
jgi:hypothetical protein